MGQEMPRVIPQVIAAMKSDPSISGLVGTQVYADYPPQGVDHTFVIVSTVSGIAHGTISNCQVRAYSARLSVDVVCNTRSEAEGCIEAIEDTLDGFTSTDASYPIQGITLDGGMSWDLLTPKDGSDERSFICSQDYQIHYRRLN